MTARLAVVAVVMTLLSTWTYARPNRHDGARFDFAAAIPLSLPEWIGRDAPPLDRDVAKVVAADEYVHRYYGLRGVRAADGESRVADIEIDIAYYNLPQAGAAMHSPLNCLPGNGWEIVKSDLLPLTIDTQRIDVRRLVVAQQSDRLAMTYWFQNRGRAVGSEYGQRLELLKNGFRGRPTDAALVRVMAADTPEGHAALTRFTRELVSVLTATFR